MSMALSMPDPTIHCNRTVVVAYKMVGPIVQYGTIFHTEYH